MKSMLVRTAALAGVLLCLVAYLCATAEGKAPIISGDRMVRTIALTFDDGPHETLTCMLLDALWELDVRASFFLVGKMAERQPALVREIFARGHTVANHSHTHRNFSGLSAEELLEELRRCNEVLEYNVPVPVRFFRPPGGNYTKEVLALVEEIGLKTVLWDINSRDYTGVPASVMTTRIVSKAAPGSILLFHSGVTSTIQALPEIVRRLRVKGFDFVTLDEMFFEQKALRPKNPSLQGSPQQKTVRHPM